MGGVKPIDITIGNDTYPAYETERGGEFAIRSPVATHGWVFVDTFTGILFRYPRWQHGRNVDRVKVRQVKA